MVPVSAVPPEKADAKRPGMHSNAKRWNEAVRAWPKWKPNPSLHSHSQESIGEIIDANRPENEDGRNNLLDLIDNKQLPIIGFFIE